MFPYCRMSCCLVATSMANLSYKFWVAAEQKSVSLFHKYFRFFFLFFIYFFFFFFRTHQDTICLYTTRLQTPQRGQCPEAWETSQGLGSHLSFLWGGKPLTGSILGPSLFSFPVARTDTGACNRWWRLKGQSFSLLFSLPGFDIDETLQTVPEHPFSPKLLSSSAFPCEWLHFQCISIFLTWKYFLEKFLTGPLLDKRQYLASPSHLWLSLCV